MKNNPSDKQTLRSPEIVLLGGVQSLTKGIEIGNLKDQSRVGWRPGTLKASAKKKAPSKQKAAKKKK